MGLLERMTGRGGEAGKPGKDSRGGGLLSAAASLKAKTADSETPMERSCRDSILRLGPVGNTADTALSVIKAYYPFDSGACLARGTDAWVSYASLGVETGIGKALALPLSSLSVERGVVEIGTAGSLGIGALRSASRLWAFPFRQADEDFILLLAEAADGPLPVKEISSLLASCASSFARRTPRGPHGDDELRTALAAAFDTRRREKELRLLIVERSAAQGAVLSADTQEPGADDFLARSRAAVSAVGNCERLSGKRLIVAVPSSIDKDLLSHRIVKSLSSAIGAGRFSVVADALASTVEEALAFALRNR